ncbi:uncharacterized protein LOC128890584 isoform X1 [Hylaeus anthracinus]|uniref:uncharacterized protein LOC128890584 isoform X1 n=2 Tax=Hylaeus anthracinus TaxID=313031 RepID=UPI0023B8ED45|nr:uncharacterized protein LOC128890584 isoform X1 [Hylaeus anthracinus]
MKMIVARTLIVVSLIGTQVLGYPPQERLMPDGAPVPEDAVEHEDSVVSASNVDEEYEDGDDSDIYMEPDEAESEDADKGEEEKSKKSTEDVSIELTEKTVAASSNATTQNVTKDQDAQNTEETGQADVSDSEIKSLETESQNFFPSFAELFANHRLPFTEQRYRPNRFLGYFQRDRSGFQTSAATAKDVQHPLLGSGNFGVIRGGTYYPEEKENDEYSADDSVYNPYYHGGNRGRANYYRNPKPQPVRGGDFFANFRDFADITAPPKSSFSHLSVVYANKNGSATGRITEPRNIIETLRMLEEEGQTNAEATTTTEVPRKKQSKGKRKLIKMKQYEDDKARRSRMTMEPLLALS